MSDVIRPGPPAIDPDEEPGGRCAIPGCGRPTLARGWCNRHWKRWKRHGDPYAGRTAPGEPSAYFELMLLRETDDCIDWPYTTRDDGYGELRLGGSLHRVHVLACERAHGSCPAGQVAAHQCGRRSCFNPRHLRWATRSDNEADKLIHGTSNRGERHPMARLTEAAAVEIRHRCAAGEPHADVAAAYGVARSTVSQIACGRNWSWLDTGERIIHPDYRPGTVL